MTNLWEKHQCAIICGVFEIIFIVFFCVFSRYPTNLTPVSVRNFTVTSDNVTTVSEKQFAALENVHIMVFIGFGYLMTFLKRYGYSAVGFNFLLATFTIQWSIIFRGILHMILTSTTSFEIGMFQILLGDMSAVVVLISVGVTLGKLSPTQYIIMGFFEVVFATLNEHVCLMGLQVNDIGGSMIIHLFGAYFGLGIAKVLHKQAVVDNRHAEPVYHSDLFAMIGTLFLWVFWPRFNSALASPEDSAQRAALNTFLALFASCVSSFVTTSIVNNGKYTMDCIQNSTLAGGVAIGSVANLIIQPSIALCVGFLAGPISVLGFKFITPFLANVLNTHDTCGVHNLHGIPAIFGGIVGTIAVLFVGREDYGDSLYVIFPSMSRTLENPRTANIQAVFQLGALGLSLGFSLLSGLLTGLILKIPICNEVHEEDHFKDVEYWHLPNDFDPFAEQYHPHVPGGNQVMPMRLEPIRR